MQIKLCEKTLETYLQTLYGICVIKQNTQSG